VPGHRVGRLFDQRNEQLLFGTDVVIERRTVDADLDGDVLQAGSREPVTAEDLSGSLENRLPPLAGGSAVGIAPFIAPTCVVALLACGGNRLSSWCVASR